MSTKPHAADHDSDPWETGELGRSLEHAEVVEDEKAEAAIDAALNLRLISIRLEQGLIEAFKLIASRNKNIGYQTLMRQALNRFAVAEIKRIANEMAAELRAAEKAQKEAADAAKAKAAAA
jgi:predicted DNA binding CopG/RHH family protein